MLIGIDASRAVTATPTGTEHYARFLIAALLELDVDNRYRLYFRDRPEENRFPHDERVAWRVMGCPRLWTHTCLAWETVRRPPDVLFVPAHVLPIICRPPAVVTVHDLGHRHYPQAHTAWSRAYLEWGTRQSVRRAAHVIADSRATRQDLTRFYDVPADKITVAYPAAAGGGFHPVDDPDVLADVRQRYHTGRRYFIFVGSLHPRKNLLTLLEAYARLRQEGALPPDVRLVLVGKRAWLYDRIVARAREADLRNSVVLTGYVPQEDLPALISGAIAFVMPSWHEGFGLPVLEAMACHTPVICSNASSLPEAAGDAALLFSPDDVEALSDAMRRIYEDVALRQELIQRGAKQVTSFTWQACARQVLSVLERVGSGG